MSTYTEMMKQVHEIAESTPDTWERNPQEIPTNYDNGLDILQARWTIDSDFELQEVWLKVFDSDPVIWIHLDADQGEVVAHLDKEPMYRLVMNPATACALWDGYSDFYQGLKASL